MSTSIGLILLLYMAAVAIPALLFLHRWGFRWALFFSVLNIWFFVFQHPSYMGFALTGVATVFALWAGFFIKDIQQ
jgi:hypothetical protein